EGLRTFGGESRGGAAQGLLPGTGAGPPPGGGRAAGGEPGGRRHAGRLRLGGGEAAPAERRSARRAGRRRRSEHRGGRERRGSSGPGRLAFRGQEGRAGNGMDFRDAASAERADILREGGQGRSGGAAGKKREAAGKP